MDDFNGQRPGNETYNAGGPVPAKQNNTLGIIGLVSGILAIILALCCPPVGIFLGLVALICGFIAKTKNQNFAMAAIILGVLSIGAAIIIPIVFRGILGHIDWTNFDFEEFFQNLE